MLLYDGDMTCLDNLLLVDAGVASDSNPTPTFDGGDVSIPGAALLDGQIIPTNLDKMFICMQRAHEHFENILGV
jgi:hypothetical protein